MKAIDLFEDGRLANLSPNAKLLMVYLHLLAEEAGTPEDALAFLSEEDVYNACHFDSVHDAWCAMHECAERLKAESGKNRQTAPSPLPCPPCPPPSPALSPTPPISLSSPPNNPPKHQPPQPASAGALDGTEKPDSSGIVTKKSGKRYEYDAFFDEWWKAYPGTRKDSKSRTYAKWRTLLQRGSVNYGDLFIGLLRWINSEEWQKDDGQFICAPLVWLNKERWMATPKHGRTVLTEITADGNCTYVYTPPTTSAKPTHAVHDEKLKQFLIIYPKGAGDFDRLLFAWDTVTRGMNVLPDDLIRAAKLACNSKQFTDDDGRYIPKPERWLEDKGWFPFISKFEEERKARAIQNEANQPPPDIGFDPFGKD